MMSAEQPFLSSLIARLDEPSLHLAAFGVAYSIALIFEAPVIMLLSAVTALVRDRKTYQQTFRFTLFLVLLVTFFLLFTTMPPMFSFLSRKVLHLPQKIIHLTHLCLIYLIPWPAAIGFRRFYQGILIVQHKTKLVALGTITRLSVMSIVAYTLFIFHYPGAATGAIALSAGVSIECVTTWLMAKKTSKHLQSIPQSSSRSSFTLAFLVRFYLPLAITSFLSLGVHPIATFFISKSQNALESLAVLPVINALVFIFRSLGLSFQEVAITFLDNQNHSRKQITRFAWLIGVSVFLGMSLLALTPLNKFWYLHVSGLHPDLAKFAFIPTMILILLPSLTVLLSFQRAVLVKNRATHSITTASFIEIVLIVLSIAVLTGPYSWVGVTAAALSFVLGRLGANYYLWPRVKKFL